MTRERPIIFSAPMVRAILEGRKTVTRRIVKNLPTWIGHTVDCVDGIMTSKINDEEHEKLLSKCPYGFVGDKLWVREQFSKHERLESPYYLPPDYPDEALGCHYWADGNPEGGDWCNPISPLFMPRWASRITLELTDVRVERLQDITEEEAKREGVRDIEHHGPGSFTINYERAAPEDFPRIGKISYRAAFANLWDSLYADAPEKQWDANPRVWRLEFKRIKQWDSI